MYETAGWEYDGSRLCFECVLDEVVSVRLADCVSSVCARTASALVCACVSATPYARICPDHICVCVLRGTHCVCLMWFCVLSPQVPTSHLKEKSVAVTIRRFQSYCPRAPPRVFIHA